VNRWLAERDHARDDGDKLASAVLALLKGKADETELALALMNYCQSQGWHGPACTLVKDILDFEQR
jgi:hypothetical protein